MARTGRQTTSLRDGLAVAVDSTMTIEQARAFYQERLRAEGWTATPAGRGATANLPIALLEFTKGSMTYQATITARAEGGTRIGIVVREN